MTRWLIRKLNDLRIEHKLAFALLDNILVIIIVGIISFILIRIWFGQPG